MSEPAISVEGLSKRYKIGLAARADRNFREVLTDWLTAPWRRFRTLSEPASAAETFWALRDVDFRVDGGEVVGIIGRNGAGKSTLLKILSQITLPTEGRAVIRGRVGSLLEVGTGFHPDLSGRENIYLNGALLGMTRADIARRFDKIVAFSGIEGFLDTPVKRYSSGMRVRLGFAVAAHLEPEILIVDEVLAVGDAAFQKKCLGKMGQVAREGRTVLFVSHNMSAVTALCNRAILLEGGAIAVDGEVADAIDGYLGRDAGSLEALGPTWTFDEETARAAQITGVRLLDVAGQPSARHRLDDPVTIEIDFLLRRDFANLVASCQVRSRMGALIYNTFDGDWTEYTTGRKPMAHPKAAGRYTAVVTLPAPLLNADTYELTVNLLTPNAAVHDTADRIFFEIVDPASFASSPFNRRRQGTLAIPVAWTLSREHVHA
ncbi:MAG: ABC transporter ATP-binding protein [Planctomycetota bacterium]